MVTQLVKGEDGLSPSPSDLTTELSASALPPSVMIIMVSNIFGRVYYAPALHQAPHASSQGGLLLEKQQQVKPPLSAG